MATSQRVVNQLSASQEMRMLRKSLEELDEKTIANALGMSGISHRLNMSLMDKLDSSVFRAFEASKLNLQCAKELAHVKTDRQAEILKLMESCNDYSVTFARGTVLKTPVAKRAKLNGKRTPWTQADERKNDLLKKLREAEQQQDYYSGLYRQYTTNLLKLVIYVRSLVANPKVKQHMRENHPQQLVNLRANHPRLTGRTAKGKRSSWSISSSSHFTSSLSIRSVCRSARFFTSRFPPGI